MDLSHEQIVEIEEARADQHMTRRATVPELDKILHTPFPVLDHGFVRVIDYMGDDAAIVQAARVSYGKGTKKKTSDAGLINYLMRHRHTTPFEMCELKLHVKLPIFVARQWIRHRTANVNEYSARYSVLDREFYIPGAESLAQQSTSNKQGRGQGLAADDAERIRKALSDNFEAVYDLYAYLLNEDGAGNPEDPERIGIARELARLPIPVSAYTQWYWKIDLHNLLHFLSLRMDSHAQYEIRAYADVIGSIAEKWVPAAWNAFLEYRLGSLTLSATAAETVRRLLAGENVTRETCSMSSREWDETLGRLGLKG